jgi:hypothetical protein
MLRGRFWGLEGGFSLPSGQCPETGKVTILRFVAAHDVSGAIHPSYVEGQIPKMDRILPRLLASPPRQPNTSGGVCCRG